MWRWLRDFLIGPTTPPEKLAALDELHEPPPDAGPEPYLPPAGAIPPPTDNDLFPGEGTGGGVA
jgi:hypothetical protein